MRGSPSKHVRHNTSLARRVHPTQLCGWVPEVKNRGLRFRALLTGSDDDLELAKL